METPTPLSNVTFQDAINKWFSTEGTYHADVVSQYGQLSDWNVSLVTNMSNAFNGRIMSGTGTGFFTGNQPNESVSNWNTANVTNMYCMFMAAPYFNGNLKTIGNMWNTRVVENMNFMFNGATNFEGNGINTWNTQAVRFMLGMFSKSRPPRIFSKPNAQFGGNVNLTTVTNAFRYATLVQQGTAHKGRTVYVAQAPAAIFPPRNRF